MITLITTLLGALLAPTAHPPYRANVGRRALAAITLGRVGDARPVGVTRFGCRLYVAVEDRDGQEHYV